ncbi:D-ribose pyranase [Ignavibacteria bacterium 4148-Me]|uniref:D-ribose pyranase n=1 Tax=Rosettibacter primus TaxID=3111523 RepID=UPI00336BE2B1
MKKNGILNAELSYIIASMGHSDKLVITDCGLPIPKGVPKVDLALKKNLPGFIETVKTILNELVVEYAIISEELQIENPKNYQKLMELLKEINVKKVKHEEFKKLIKESNVSFVRTGEATPYSNIILVSGVDFA